MSYTVIPAALIITFLIVALFSLFLKKPLRGFTLFFLLIFLVTWSGSLWINPFGPLTWGIPLIPMVFVGFLFSFLILAIAPLTKKGEEPVDEPLIAAGIFFWILLVVLIIVIGFGYYRGNNLIA